MTPFLELTYVCHALQIHEALAFWSVTQFINRSVFPAIKDVTVTVVE